jgi:hypothetical protein
VKFAKSEGAFLRFFHRSGRRFIEKTSLCHEIAKKFHDSWIKLGYNSIIFGTILVLKPFMHDF